MEFKIKNEDQELLDSININQRRITPETIAKFEGYVAEIFSAFGMDLNLPSTHETPQRFIKALYDATEGYDGDPKLLKIFDIECRNEPDCRLSQVIEGPINFFSLCEHHVFPFYGHAHIGYIANGKIIGISKLTRLVRVFSKRFAVQEKISQQIADTLELMLEPHGVAVYLEAHHLCVEMRGVRETAPKTRSMVWRGIYAEDANLRSEFLTSCCLEN
jgi:GTP cyclohydrolase IA